MRILHISAIATLLLVATSLPAAMPRVRRGPTAPRAAKLKPAAKTRASAQSIDSERATQIQQALIKSGYMTGTPSGTWDAQTQAAMEKLQSDNGWQTKLVPDSRAIIKLGLGSGKNTALALGNPASDEVEAPVTPEPIAIPAINK